MDLVDLVLLVSLAIALVSMVVAGIGIRQSRRRIL